MPSRTQSILLGSLVVALLSTSYLGLINVVCCAGVIIGALVTVWHYTDTHELTIPAGQGASMGLAAAFIGAIIALILNFVLIKIGIRSDQFMLDAMLDAFGDSMPDEQYDDLLEQRNRPVTFGSYFIEGVLGVIVSAVMGAIGGAIGAAVFKKGTVEDEGF